MQAASTDDRGDPGSKVLVAISPDQASNLNPACGQQRSMRWRRGSTLRNAFVITSIPSSPIAGAISCRAAGWWERLLDDERLDHEVGLRRDEHELGEIPGKVVQRQHRLEACDAPADDNDSGSGLVDAFAAQLWSLLDIQITRSRGRAAAGP